jgi:protein disulfide-isomerase
MEEEVLSQQAFMEKIVPHALLWSHPLHADGSLGEKRLRDKYKIEECPMLLLLDPRGREFARYGYLPLDPVNFAEQLVDTMEDFKEICLALNEKEPKNAAYWMELYQKAKQFSSSDFKKLILERGIQEDSSDELLLEKYALLLEQNGIKSHFTKKCKKKLLEQDPENQQGTHYKIAMIEFHSALNEKKISRHPKKALHPLLGYLKRFQDKDRDNAWNAEWTIANYFLGLKSKKKALEYAKRAYSHSPEDAKENIAKSIAYMEAQ